MIEKILKALKANQIGIYRLNDVITESTEVFFVKKRLDTRRICNTETVKVTVYKDFEKDGVRFLGNADFSVEPSATEEEISEMVKKAYLSAGFVTNKYYDIAEKLVSDTVVMKSDIADVSAEEAVSRMVEALFRNDTDSNTFVNSAEFFVTKDTVRILNSNGVDVGYVKYGVNGEFVCQCKSPEDVETYANFAYDDLETEQLAEKVKETLQMTKDRAVAVKNPVNGNCNVVLANDYAYDVYGVFGEKNAAPYKFLGYFDTEIGKSIQGEDIQGDKITLDFIATTPFSVEGLKMEDIKGIDKGVLCNYIGDLRYCQYIGVKPTGYYSKARVESGSMSFEEMKKQVGLYVVNFSDFQVDPILGVFRGEIRLAYYNDGSKVIPVTGGSVNGIINEVQKNFNLSVERQDNKRVSGPKAIFMRNVAVAGCEE